jgi:hypothetical protein
MKHLKRERQHIVDATSHLRSVLIVAFRNLPASTVYQAVRQAHEKVEAERAAK